MGSEESSKPIEDVVGGLVWIRRRNGSWWPGRIMGLDELPHSLSSSSRSGTPVKLLGREDASVDWYNLEKSKRVKAFRCGEYDECIEKAKASAANANKKAVKYARREDAILHALELESARESDEHHGFHSGTGGSTFERQGLCVRKPKRVSSSDSEYDDMDFKESTVEEDLTKGFSQSVLTFDDPSRTHTMQAHMHKMKRKTPNDSEDDGSEGTKRMRGLEDLGTAMLSKIKSCVHSDSEGCPDSEGSDELVQHNGDEAIVCSSITNGSPVNKCMDAFSQVRKKQVQVALAHENLKRRNRSLPLTKVLESATVVSVPVFRDQGVSQGQSSLQGGESSKVSALEATDSKKATTSAVTNNNMICDRDSCDKETYLDASIYARDAGADGRPILSDQTDSDISAMLELTEKDGPYGLFDVPFVREKKYSQDTSRKLQSSSSGRPWNHCSIVEPTSLHNGELDESGSTDLIVDVGNIIPMGEHHTSKWQSKRKRNSRIQSHRTSKHMDLSRCVDRELDASLTLEHQTDDFFHGFEQKGNFDELLPFDNSVHCNSREPTYLDSLSYGTESVSYKEVTKMRMLSTLPPEKSVASKLATQMRNKELYLREESVSPLLPHRSLPYRQSRFTPHSKYQDAYVPTRNTFENSSLFDVNLEVRASYPGRHVPMISLCSKLDGKAIVGHPVTVEVCNDGYTDHLLNNLACSSDDLYEVPGNTSDQSMDAAGTSFQGRYGKLVGSHQDVSRHVPSPVSHMRSLAPPTKSSKARKGGLLSKKTRKLSSFVVSDPRDKDRKPMIEKLGAPVIACVPLNIVFSRINEALKGPARSAHRN